MAVPTENYPMIFSEIIDDSEGPVLSSLDKSAAAGVYSALSGDADKGMALQSGHHDNLIGFLWCTVILL